MGVDPGLIQTGFGIISIRDNQSTLIDYGIIKPSPKDNLARRLLTIFNDVCKIITDFKPQVFAIEDIFYGKNVKSAMRLGQARGASMVAAASKQIPIYEYSARKWECPQKPGSIYGQIYTSNGSLSRAHGCIRCSGCGAMS